MGGRNLPSERRRQQTLLRLHADVVAFATPETLAYSSRIDFPATGAIHFPYNERFHEPLFERLREQESWTYPDGTLVERPQGIVAERFDGSGQLYTHESVIPSVFGPGFLDIAKARAEREFELGYTAIMFGNVREMRVAGLDFSRWAQASFRDHLGSLSVERLTELGISDPGSFNIRQYLRDYNLTPNSSNHPAEDPVFREYLLNHHRGVKDALGELKTWLEGTYPDRSAPFFIDQPIGDSNLAEASVAETYVSEHVDLVSVEDWRTMPAEDFGFIIRHGEVKDRDVPAKDIRDYVYKLMLATAKFNKPVHCWDPFGGSYYSDIDSTTRYPMLTRLQAAEAFAMGARRDLALRDEAFSWREPDGSVPTVLQDFIDFLWAHQRFLSDTEPDNDVAVIWSLPTLLWNTIPQWGLQPTDHTHTFLGTVTLLRESQLPYDVLVFGHSNLWPDGSNLDRLSTYDAVILPAVESVSDAQLATLNEYVSTGGVLLTSGAPPGRNGWYEPRDDVSTLFEQEQAVVLASNPGKQRLDDGATDGPLIKSLEQAEVGTIRVEADDTLGVNRLSQPDASRMILHLLNYDYDPGVDAFTPKRDFEITLTDLDEAYRAARFYSPQRTTDLRLTERDDGITISVPELIGWGFVVFAPSESYYEDEGEPTEAEAAVKDAASTIQEAREEGRDSSIEYAIANEKLRAAHVALDHDADSLARQSAEEAVVCGEKAFGQPVIAFDHAHVHPETLGKNAVEIEQYRERFPEYGFEPITQWDEEILSGVDVLIVPPALAFKDQSYGFTSQELDQIEAFVANGGSIMVLGSGGMASGIDALTDRLDFRFLKQNIVDKTDKKVPAAPTNCRTELTAGMDTLDMTASTAIERLPEHGRILVRIPENSTAWIHESGDFHQRENDEESAAGLPVYTVHQYGDGLVTALGHRRFHYWGNVFDDDNPLVGNSLSVLSRHSQQSRGEVSQELTDRTSSSGQSVGNSATTHQESRDSPTSAESSQPGPAPSQPGFGAGTALASITGAALLLRWLRGRDQ